MTMPFARCVLYVSQQNNVEILPHPPYSPDKTPCDFWLFPQLKKLLRGKRFASNKACVKAAHSLNSNRTLFFLDERLLAPPNAVSDSSSEQPISPGHPPG
ncbi:histone-lysine N-methyltransferase SETMAR [Trichonephila clavipes]|nr:histone-lysine N-methyltransferase SETMAR [Trichonephila clavipes]